MLFEENTALNLKGVLKQITFNYSFTLGQKKYSFCLLDHTEIVSKLCRIQFERFKIVCKRN